ncbi:MAG: transglycosylase domain-containing protein [Deltaproteobacteria bacterium]|nr:transglycosylase domain-containing protein [Deltaproteobacteria bacterium]
MTSRARLRKIRIRVTLGLAIAVNLFFLWVFAVPFPEDALTRTPHTSTMILDRDGRLLREVLSAEATRGRWVPLAEISPNLVLATIHAEDRRFRDHAGSDFLAIARSLWIDLRAGEARTGASTLTQQTVKLTLQAGAPRDLGTKLMEVIWAWRLEMRLSKDEILEQYLNRAPYGSQLIGAEAASWMYFGKPAAHLSLAEAAYLAGLPNSPSRLTPYRSDGARVRALQRQRWILGVLLERGAIDLVAYQAALNEPLRIHPRRSTPTETVAFAAAPGAAPASPAPSPALPPVVATAPHLTARLAKELFARPADARPATLRTTIDRSLQTSLAALLAAQAPPDAKAGDFQAAAVVLDTQTSEVLAWVGSRGFEDADALGQNDGVVALRQPGSALKPFIYAALLDGSASRDPTSAPRNPYARTFIDAPTTFATPTGPYRPENFDRTFHGEVSLRVALGSSLNIPAIKALDEIGVPTALALLRRLGLETLDAGADHYGLGLALGNGEVRLLDLAGAYATLGRLGVAKPVRWLADGDPAPSPPTRLISRETAFVLLDMLADASARGIGFGLAGPFELPYRIAAKTGTSSDFRDNWAVAVTPRHTLAVWVGNFDGRPMARKPGKSGAAPLLRQVAQLLYPHAAAPSDVPWFTPPPTLERRMTASGALEWAPR